MVTYKNQILSHNNRHKGFSCCCLARFIHYYIVKFKVIFAVLSRGYVIASCPDNSNTVN
ncbi:hypothetical protein Barb6XT_02923 [Bacteroidales bacterium Barb6XT]|nr:hypothetical protein Barb6XT_02923 [Bacteroidales bacterium Barb6XT]